MTIRGKVVWFNRTRGFGFIAPDTKVAKPAGAKGEDIFVHYTGIQGNGFRTLREGQHVEFFVADTNKGPMAQDVKTLD